MLSYKRAKTNDKNVDLWHTLSLHEFTARIQRKSTQKSLSEYDRQANRSHILRFLR